MNTDGIIIQKSEQGKLIGAAKRVWVAAKKEIIKRDNIEKNEAALFVNDLELAKLAKAKKLLDEKITSHIDEVLIDYRGYDAIELAEKRQSAMIDLTRDFVLYLEDIIGRDENCEMDDNERKAVLELHERGINALKDIEGAE